MLAPRRTLVSLFALLALLLVPTAGASEDRTVPVRVEPGGLERAGVDAVWVERYGTFEWAEVRSEDVVRLRGAGVEVETHPEVRTLVLPSARFDPLESAPGDAAVGERPSLALVQFRAPTRDAWLASLRRAGASLVQPVAPFSYIVLADASSLAAIRRQAFVRWAGGFDPAFRFGDLDASAGTVNVVLVGSDLDSALARLDAISTEVRVTGPQPFMDVEGLGVQVDVDAAGLQALSRLPEAYSITPQRDPQMRDELSDQIVATIPGPDGTPTPGYNGVLSRHGVTGEGVVVAHVDSGVDMSHQDLDGREHGCIDYHHGGAGCADGGVDQLGHGTHTAGIVAGNADFGGKDSAGYLYGLGVAPGARLFVQNYTGATAPADPSGPGQYQELNRHSVSGGAVISANSWGPSGTPQGYDADTREFDSGPRDADLTTPSDHQPIVSVFSIMNGSGGSQTQGSPDEGKNLLRVGSTRNLRSAGAETDHLGAESAHGPALDGRRLPDVVAPGNNVISTKSSNAVPPFCATPIADSDGAIYSSCTGTSMASPHVSGGAALFFEHYRQRFHTDPSPALVKAAFVNGAVDLAGGRDADGAPLGHIPDNKQGWGRFNLENVLGGAAKAYLDQTVVLDQTGANYRAQIQPVDPRLPVKVTLAWTDALGHGMGGTTPAWVNDLDLRVTAGGSTFLGNSFGDPSTGWSVQGGAADFRNNLENVYLQSAPSTPVSVEVRAANIAGDGIPGSGDTTDQDFVLVISNGRLLPSTCGVQVPAGVNPILGTEGPDILRGTALPDMICGLGGRDRIRGRQGRDILVGNGANDRIVGASGADRLVGGGGRDRLGGGRGRDTLLGGSKQDRLGGQAGRDRMNGGPGKDRCAGGRGGDRARACERET